MVAPSAEEVRRQVCYELKWMLYAVVRFEEIAGNGGAGNGRSGRGNKLVPADLDLVALQDSALMHARNLVEFADAAPDEATSKVQWALVDILGTHRRKVPGNAARFLNNWVAPLGEPKRAGAKWPKDVNGAAIDPDDRERLSKVTEVVFKLLKPKHRTMTLETEAGAAYIELLDRARDYFESRTLEAFERLTCDGSPMPGA